MLVAAPSASAASTGWRGYLHDAAHSSFGGSTSINVSNAAGVHLVRSLKLGPLQATPAVSSGIAYIGDENGDFRAINLSTGAVLWTTNLGTTPSLFPGCRVWGVTSSATLANDPATGALTVYVGGGDEYLYALRASDGSVLWRTVLGALPSQQYGYYNWSSPTVLGSHVYYGLSSQCEGSDGAGFVRGGVVDISRASGKLLHTYWGVPDGDVGGGVFTSVAAEGTTVWATTGSAPEPPAPQGDSYSMVSLNATTFARTGIWTVPGNARLVDSDFGSSPTLFTAGPTRMVGACNKNGVYYAFTAANVAAGPVWQRQLGDAQSLSGIRSCLGAAIWDGSRLIAPGDATTIAGISYGGSLRSLDPISGRILWERGFASNLLGSPSENGAGVVAASTYSNVAGATTGTYLINAATGALLKTISNGPAYPQPVFAGPFLVLANRAGDLKIYRP